MDPKTTFQDLRTESIKKLLSTAYQVETSALADIQRVKLTLPTLGKSELDAKKKEELNADLEQAEKDLVRYQRDIKILEDLLAPNLTQKADAKSTTTRKL